MCRFVYIFILIVIIFSGMVTGQNSSKLPFNLNKKDMEIEIPDFKFSTNNNYIKVIRKYKNNKENELLKIAESIYPDKELIFNYMETAFYKVKTIPSKSEGIWWYAEYEGIRVPYTVTRAAVKYYLDMFDDRNINCSNCKILKPVKKLNLHTMHQ